MSASRQLGRQRCASGGSRSLTVWLVAAGLLASFACTDPRTEQDLTIRRPDSGATRPPPEAIENADGCPGRPCGAQVKCSGNERCLHGVCLPDHGSCHNGDDCSDDQRCYDGGCVQFAACTRLAPIDIRCLGGSFPPDQFQSPEVLCHLHDVQVQSTPIVADLDHDGKPEVIAVAFPDTLVALRPSDCTVRFRKKGLSLLSDGHAQLAVADLDGDGFAEIVTLDAERRVVVFDHRGELRARAEVPVRERNPYDEALWSAPTIADIDGTAPPEIIAGAQVTRFVAGPPARVQVLWTQPNQSAYWGSIPVVADLDGDGNPEVISSDRIYDGRTGADKTPESLAYKPFYAQVADFTGDGKPDLLLIESEKDGQSVRIFDYARRQLAFGPYAILGGEGGWGGPAVIADLDRDGVPDFAVASSRRFYAYALLCAATPKPSGCSGPEPGVLWSRPIDDSSSGSAGASALDLNGDGVPELVHRDECWVRIFSGLDGRVLAARTLLSSTGLEVPVLADADGDGRADLVVTSDVPNDNFVACMHVGQPEADTRTPWGGIAGGIFVLRDPQNRWARTRAVWNQHAYQITNITDALEVPIPAPDSWRVHNTFRLNPSAVRPPGSVDPKHDLTARFRTDLHSPDCDAVWLLSAWVCNRGGAPAPAPVAGTFYDGDPQLGAKAVCTSQLQAKLAPGQCAELACSWPKPPPGPRTLVLRIGDDGRGGRDTMQCSTGNDLATWPDAGCLGQPR